MRTLLCLFVLTTTAIAEDSPIARLAGVSFTVADIEKARRFYSEVLGLEEAFSLKHSDGSLQTVYFKINDDQYLDFSPCSVEGFRLDRVTFVVPGGKAPQLALLPVVSALSKRGVASGAIAKTPEGDMGLSIRDPDRIEIRFVHRLPGSLFTENRSKSPRQKRASEHLHHVALAADSEQASLAPFRDALGLTEF